MTTRELAPLAEISTRQEAMSRCIGPLTTLAAIKAIDGIRANPENLQQGINFFHERYSHKDLLSSPVALRVASEAITHTLHLMGVVTDGPCADTDEQAMMMRTYTYRGYVSGILEETFEAQGEITGRLALPGYIACQLRETDPWSFADYYITSRASDTTQLLRSQSFMTLLNDMSIGYNGTYRKLFGLSREDEDDYICKVDIFASKDLPTRNNAHTAHSDTFASEISVDITDVCEYSDTDIVISRKMRNALAMLMRAENSPESGNKWSVGQVATTGCPARKQYFKTREDDFTDQQWVMFTEGDNPVASYDTETQRLKILRNPINELNDLLADTTELSIQIQEQSSAC